MDEKTVIQILSETGLSLQTISDGPTCVFYQGKSFSITVRKNRLVLKENKGGIFRRRYRFCMEQLKNN